MGGSSIQVSVPGGPFNLRYAGVDCTGATASTTALQSAVNTYPSVLVPRSCTIVTNTISLPANIEILGDGPTSVIKLTDNATGHLLVQTNAGARTRLYNLTLDGNYENNGGDGAATRTTLRLTAAGASDTQPGTVIVDTVRFINGGQYDVGAAFSDPAYPLYYYESNTQHFGGADGGQYGGFSQVHAFLNNILMDPQRLPTGTDKLGRSGYLFSQNSGSDSAKHSLSATNVQCYRTGRASNTSASGCLESYQGGGAVAITNSFSKLAVGRGFAWKADARNVMVANLLVEDLSKNPDNPSSAIGSCFMHNPGAITGSEDEVGYNVTMTNLVCRNTAGGGVDVLMRNDQETAVGTNAVLHGLIVDTCTDNSGDHYALNLRDVNHVKVSNVLIKDCPYTIRVRQDASTPGSGPVSLTDVQTTSGSAPSFDAASKANLWVARNNFYAGPSASDLTATVSANAVRAWSPLVLANTASSPQTVNTINGVPDGETVTIRASSASNILTLASGGNLSLRNSIAIKDTTSSFTFRNLNGTLYPVGFDTPSLIGFATSAGALTLKPEDGSTANGNARGTSALDLQPCAGAAATEVASGVNSIAIGCQNTASGNTATAIGYLNSATGTLGVATGTRSADRGRFSYLAFASGRFAASGDAQVGQAVLRASTTSTSATRLTADAAAAGSANIANLVNNQSMSFEIVVDVRDTTTGDEATYVGITGTVPRCKIKRGANAAATAMVGTCTMTELATPAGSLTGLTAPTVTADTTNGGLNVTFTNVTANATRVVASVRALEVQ